MKTAAYMRVSTGDQSVDLQRDALERYAGRAGLSLEWFIDGGVSGAQEKRPALDRLIRAAHAREIQCVLVWKFDRFARSTKHLVLALEEFEHLGIRFISAQEQIDTRSPMGRMMFTLIAAFAELERSIIAERVRAGMEAARDRGTHVGRPPVDAHLKADVEHLARTTDLSISKITEQVGGLSRSKVGAIVQSVRSNQPAS